MMKVNRNSSLKRVIVDYKKLNNDILELLVQKYPDGYDDDDVITFKNSSNEVIECIEIRTETTAYLVKVSKRLTMAMAEFEEDDDNEDTIDNGNKEDLKNLGEEE